jgi:16S rRNA (cytidine1402-2'-O)-methyltransferase
MASGMNGQQFAFHGYLPIGHEEKYFKIQHIEKVSRQTDATQIFIEAPYRNQALLRSLLEFCQPDTLLCLATDITLEGESIRTKTITSWKKNPPEINRRPTVFLLYAAKN